MVFDSRESADASQAGDLGCPLAGGIWSLGGRLDTRGDGPSRVVAMVRRELGVSVVSKSTYWGDVHVYYAVSY